MAWSDILEVVKEEFHDEFRRDIEESMRRTNNSSNELPWAVSIYIQRNGERSIATHYELYTMQELMKTAFEDQESTFEACKKKRLDYYVVCIKDNSRNYLLSLAVWKVFFIPRTVAPA